jgi:hypothetical protein
LYSINKLKEHYDNSQLLIILLARLYFGKACREDVDQFVRDNSIDKVSFCRLTGIHGVSSFICDILDKNDIFITEEIHHILKQRYINNQAKCFEQAVISSKLQQSLLDKSITIIPYKGVIFSHNYYGHIGLRESSDLDFIVDIKDADAIEQHLIEMGFHPKTTVPAPYKKYYRKHFKDISYVAPGYNSIGYSAEMHWRLLNAHYGEFETFAFFKQGLLEKKIGPLPFVCMNAGYDLLAVGSNHFIKDLSTKFKYIIDIACLLKKNGNEIDPSAVKFVMQKHGFEKRFEYGLFLVKALLGFEIPEYNCNYAFSSDRLNKTIEYKLVEIKISNGQFLKRSLELQDNGFAKLKFFLRCTYNYTLPMASDIPSNKKYPILLLMFMRLYRSARKVIQRFFASRRTAMLPNIKIPGTLFICIYSIP